MKYIKFKQRLFFCIVLSYAALSAQMLTPAKWHYNLSKQTVKQGEIIELVFKIQLDDTWHLYGNIQNYTLGPLPTTFEFEPHSSYELVDNVMPIGIKTKHDPIFEIDVNYFENTAQFHQKVKILSKNPIIKGSYSYQVCSIADRKCVPGAGDFEFNIKTIN